MGLMFANCSLVDLPSLQPYAIDKGLALAKEFNRTVLLTRATSATQPLITILTALPRGQNHKPWQLMGRR